MKPHRSWWVPVVILGYLLIVVAVFLSPWLWFECSASLYFEWPSIIILALWPLGLAALLFVPVQVARRRPISRRTIWIPLLTTGFLAGILAIAGAFALAELFRVQGSDWLSGAILVGGFGAWACWGGLFYLVTRTKGPNAVGLAIHRWLIAGSVLELLVAIGAHIIVRRRTECCAGIMTGIAICCGVLITLLAFGPSVALLFVHRWKRIANPTPAGHGFEIEASPGRAMAPGPCESIVR